MKGSAEDLQEERIWGLDGAAAVACWARAGARRAVFTFLLRCFPWYHGTEKYAQQEKDDTKIVIDQEHLWTALTQRCKLQLK